jgi:hypothetical protein
VHADFRPVQQQFVECDSHIHGDAADRLLKVVACLGDVQLRDRHLTLDRSARIKVLFELYYRVVIFLPKVCLALGLSFIVQPA